MTKDGYILSLLTSPNMIINHNEAIRFLVDDVDAGEPDLLDALARCFAKHIETAEHYERSKVFMVEIAKGVLDFNIEQAKIEKALVARKEAKEREVDLSHVKIEVHIGDCYIGDCYIGRGVAI